MRTIILATALHCLSAGAALAGVLAPQAADLSRPSADSATKQSAFEAAILDCERMWDRGTHMTEQDWSLTCRRVQERLDQPQFR
jgi:hypothetical protein